MNSKLALHTQHRKKTKTCEPKCEFKNKHIFENIELIIFIQKYSCIQKHQAKKNKYIPFDIDSSIFDFHPSKPNQQEHEYHIQKHARKNMN